MLLYLFVFRIKVTLNLGDFKSNEIDVKVVDNSLVVWAEHEEKPDDHGHVYRYVNRRYMLPRNVDLEQINATMSDKGQLVVCAPKKPEVKVSSDFAIDCLSCRSTLIPFNLPEGERAQH